MNDYMIINSGGEKLNPKSDVAVITLPNGMTVTVSTLSVQVYDPKSKNNPVRSINYIE